MNTPDTAEVPSTPEPERVAEDPCKCETFSVMSNYIDCHGY